MRRIILIAAFVSAGCAGTTLSDAASTACKGQSASNLATDAAVALNNPKAAELASATSAYLGLLCKW